MYLRIIELVILFAAVQGFFLVIFIFHKYGSMFANRFLGSLILLYSLILLHLLFVDIGESEMYSRVSPLILGIVFLMVPLHYLYSKYIAYSLARMRIADWLHLVPFMIWELCWIFILIFFSEHEYLWNIIFGSESDESQFVIINWLIIIQSILYIQLTLHILKKYEANIKNVFSNIRKVKLDWLRYITYLLFAIVVFFLLENVLNIFMISIMQNFAISSLLMAIYVYAIGYFGLFKSEIFVDSEIAGTIHHFQKAAPKSSQSQKKTDNSEKYYRSGLSKEKADEYLSQLLKIMDEKQPYLDNELTLDRLASILNISSHNLSEIINSRLNYNFFEFVNSYRIDKVKQDLINPDLKNLTVLAIAFNAGFNSKSSFYSIFREATDLTPTEFRREMTKFDD